MLGAAQSSEGDEVGRRLKTWSFVSYFGHSDEKKKKKKTIASFPKHSQIMG